MTLGMGIIGYGSHAQRHALYYEADFHTVGIWDPNPETTGKFSGGKYTSLAGLLSNDDVDAVMICSPDEFHLDQIEQSLRAGKHVFCEKPLLVSQADMPRLMEAFEFARECKLVLTTCHPRRYDRPMIWLKKALERTWNGSVTKKFGQPVHFDYDFSYHKPSNQWKHGRSLMLDHLNHEVDLMNALFDIEGMHAWKMHDSFDHYAVAGKRDDGITFRFRGTRRLETSMYHEWCKVHFEQGELEVDMMTGTGRIIDHEKGSIENVPNLAIDHAERLKRVTRNFAEHILGFELGYLSVPEMLMNAEVGVILEKDGIQRVDVR